MQDHTGFIAAGLRAVGEGLADLCFVAVLDREKVTLTGRMYGHVRRSLAFFELLVRRLLILMAAGLDLAPVRTSERPWRWGMGRERTAPAPRGFALIRPEHYRSDFDPAALQRAGKPRPREIVPLLYRYRTLLTLLKDPAPTARRMARYLERLRAARSPRPLCFPVPGLYRMKAELALVAAPLPSLVNVSLRDWKGRGWWDSG